MKLKNYIFILMLFIVSGCSYQSTPSSKVLSEPEFSPASVTQKVETVAATKSVPKKKPEVKIVEKKYPRYTAIGTWKLGESFSDLLPKIKDMKYEIDGEKYGSTIAFYDKDQYLYFRGGILSYVIVYKNGQGIKNGSVVGDSKTKLLNTMGKPFQTFSDGDAIYYGYGTDYSDPQLEFKTIKNKIVEISLENYTEGFTDENRGVLMYLNSIGDPAADYYVCNTCSETPINPDSNSKDNLTTNEMNKVFTQISKDMRAYVDLVATQSVKQSDYQKVFTDQQYKIEQTLDNADKKLISTEDDKLASRLNLYFTLVYDAYIQKSLSLSPGLSKYDKAHYENAAFTAITDAMTLHNEINSYLKSQK